MRIPRRCRRFGHGKFAGKYAPALVLGPVGALGVAMYGDKHSKSLGPSGSGAGSAAQIRQRAALRMQATPRPSGG